MYNLTVKILGEPKEMDTIRKIVGPEYQVSCTRTTITIAGKHKTFQDLAHLDDLLRDYPYDNVKMQAEKEGGENGTDSKEKATGAEDDYAV